MGYTSFSLMPFSEDWNRLPVQAAATLAASFTLTWLLFLSRRVRCSTLLSPTVARVGVCPWTRVFAGSTAPAVISTSGSANATPLTSSVWVTLSTLMRSYFTVKTPPTYFRVYLSSPVFGPDSTSDTVKVDAALGSSSMTLEYVSRSTTSSSRAVSAFQNSSRADPPSLVLARSKAPGTISNACSWNGTPLMPMITVYVPF